MIDAEHSLIQLLMDEKTGDDVLLKVPLQIPKSTGTRDHALFFYRTISVTSQEPLDSKVHLPRAVK